jgi:hypothetical protein
LNTCEGRNRYRVFKLPVYYLVAVENSDLPQGRCQSMSLMCPRVQAFTKRIRTTGCVTRLCRYAVDRRSLTARAQSAVRLLSVNCRRLGPM